MKNEYKAVQNNERSRPNGRIIANRKEKRTTNPIKLIANSLLRSAGPVTAIDSAETMAGAASIAASIAAAGPGPGGLGPGPGSLVA